MPALRLIGLSYLGVPPNFEFVDRIIYCVSNSLVIIVLKFPPRPVLEPIVLNLSVGMGTLRSAAWIWTKVNKKRFYYLNLISTVIGFITATQAEIFTISA